MSARGRSLQRKRCTTSLTARTQTKGERTNKIGPPRLCAEYLRKYGRESTPLTYTTAEKEKQTDPEVKTYL